MIRESKVEVLVSVVVPIYNAEQYLDRAIKSILNQQYKNLEIFLIDDGSTDNSLLICHRVVSQDKRFHVIKQKNAGPGAARNQGIQYACGELIYFMDSDDWIEPSLFEEAVRFYKLDPYDLFVFGYTKVSENGEEIGKVIPPHIKVDCLPEQKVELAELLMSGVGLAVWDKLFRTELIKNNNIYFSTQKRTEDFGFNMEVLPFVKKIRTSPIAYYNYRLVFNIKQKFDDHIVKNHLKHYKCLLRFFLPAVSNPKVVSYLLQLRTLWFGIVVPINIVAVKDSGAAQKKKRLREMFQGLQECNDDIVLRNGRVIGKFSILNRLLAFQNSTILYYCARMMQIFRRKIKLSN